MTKDHLNKSIKARGGLKKHLNDPKEVEKHRGLGYKMYVLSRKAGLNVTARAKLFNVGFDTIKHSWDVEYDREQAERRAEHEKAVDSLKEL